MWGEGVTPAVPLRRLVVVRHAKATRPSGVVDHDRPLSPRGRRDAPLLGHWMFTGQWLPDLVLCSPARRTRETWQLIAEELAAPPPVRFELSLYHPPLPALLGLVRQTPAHIHTLALVGHNPSLHDLVHSQITNALTRALPRSEPVLPTASAAVLTWRGPWHLTTGTAQLDELYIAHATPQRS